VSKLYKKINLGRKIEEDMPVKVEKKRISYPSFYVSRKRLPLKGEDVGKTFDISAKIKLVGIREENRNGKESFSYDFEMQEIQL
jgi:hypothetical protein